jgi:hypothetical protein
MNGRKITKNKRNSPKESCKGSKKTRESSEETAGKKHLRKRK